jgi:hypothetical protein
MSQTMVAVTHYCERVGDGFWAEPVNAVTNLAFLLAAAALVHALRRTGYRTRQLWDLWLLAGLMLAVGLGSFLWHTLATPWSMWADVIPILLLIDVFLLSFLVRMAQLKPIGVLFWFGFYQVLNFGLQSLFPPDFLNGSIFYLPTWATLLVMALYCRHTGHPGEGLMLAAALVFTVSLVMRTADFALCGAWPWGTHFGWHILNGLTLYLAARALIPAPRPTDS